MAVISHYDSCKLQIGTFEQSKSFVHKNVCGIKIESEIRITKSKTIQFRKNESSDMSQLCLSNIINETDWLNMILNFSLSQEFRIALWEVVTVEITVLLQYKVYFFSLLQR